MKRASSKTAKPRAPAKKRAVAETGGAPARAMLRMQEQQNLLELQNEELASAHAELEQSQQRFADLYDQAPVGYLTLDGRGCIREVNRTAGQMLGWSASHLIGKPLLPHIAAPDRKAWLKHLWESRRSTAKVITTLQLQARDGMARKVQFVTRRQEAAGPRAVFWCRTAMLDTTEKSDAQAALSASEAKFRLLAENMGEVFWFMELGPSRVTFVSPAFEQIWGVSVAELYADHRVWMKVIHPDDLDAVRTAFHRWITGEDATFRVEYRVLNREGAVRWIADRGIVIGRENGRPRQLSGIASDITERKRAEEELQLRNAEFRAKNNELERFNRAMVDRELRMIELKQEINALLLQGGQPPRYPLEFANSGTTPGNPPP